MKDSTKFLLIDRYLNFQDHIKYISGKVSRGLGILYKCKRLFHRRTLLTLYNSFIYPHLNYCNTVWCNTYSTYLEPLSKLQKRAIRMITGSRKYDHTGPLFTSLNLLKLKQIYIYALQQFIFKFRRSMLPKIFDNFFKFNRDVHDHNTRQQNHLRPPLPSSTFGSRFVRVTGVYTFSYFSDRIDMSGSFEAYKTALKSYIIKNDVAINFP